MRRKLTSLVLGAALAGFVPAAFAQKPAPKAAPMAAAPQPAPAPAPQTRQRVIIVDPIRIYDPFWDYPYPYAYPDGYMQENFGYVKIKTDHKEGSVYVDGGFADKLDKTKKFALRPGTHDIEVKDSDGRDLFHEKIAVLVGKTTDLKIG